MKKSVVAMLSMFLVVVFWGWEARAESRYWKIGHVRPSGSAIDKDLHLMVDQIKSETNGGIQIEIYPGSRLGDYSLVQERVSFGEVEMFVGPLGTAVDKKLAVAFLPFLVSNWDEAKRIYANGGIMFKTMAGFLEAQNIKLIGGWPVYFGGIALTRKPADPGNPDISKEMIIRVPPIRSFELTAKALGYTPYAITWMYAKMGLKTGMVEGILGGGAEGYLKLSPLKCYLPVKDHFEYWFVYMNLELWKRLAEADQTVIARAAREMEARRYAVGEADERAGVESLKNQGVEIIEFSDAERAAMMEKVRQKVWPVLKEEIGPAFDDVVSGN